jgi:small ligand-binding sensory domain FIST
MKAAAALVLGAGPEEAARHAVDEALAILGTGRASLAVLFATPHYSSDAGRLLGQLRAALGPVPLIGCVAAAIVGGEREVEAAPAVSLWLAEGIGPVETFAIEHVQGPNGGVFAGYDFECRGGPELLICDALSFPADEFLAQLNKRSPWAQVMGGLASAGPDARRGQLFLDARVLSSGAVGARLAGAEVHMLVSQGCRPVGNPYTVTRAAGKVLYELGGVSPLDRLKELVGSLPPEDRQLLADGGLQVGLVIDEYRDEQRRGDFLIRSVVAADPPTGAIVLADEVEVGQTVQFNVRDAGSAAEDLGDALERELLNLGDRRPAGALLFTCNGRGPRILPEADQDARLLVKVLGEVAVAGFFCAGELGPVGGRNFLHSLTASIAVFPE